MQKERISVSQDQSEVIPLVVRCQEVNACI
uniref:Uncharacterized protein n=1 Tax=Anguilla anguilla TaxID=7936 RepID=A0A0E9TBN8_ANGAN